MTQSRINRLNDDIDKCRLALVYGNVKSAKAFIWSAKRYLDIVLDEGHPADMIEGLKEHYRNTRQVVKDSE